MDDDDLIHLIYAIQDVAAIQEWDVFAVVDALQAGHILSFEDALAVKESLA